MDSLLDAPLKTRYLVIFERKFSDFVRILIDEDIKKQSSRYLHHAYTIIFTKK